MRPVIGWPIAVLFGLLSVIAFANGEALNEWVRENAIVIDSDDEATLVGITENEKWFVVLINFRDSSSNVSLWPTDQALAATPPVTIAITAKRIVVDTVANA